MDRTQRFARLVAGKEQDLALGEAALLISAHAQEGLDVDGWLERIDRLAGGVDSFKSWHERMFVEAGFSGDAETYHAVENSLLDRVLVRRRGMPITLAVIGIEVGRRAGLPIAGIGMPGHFLLRHDGEPACYVDAFAGGRLLDAAGCEAIFRRISDPSTAFRDEYLRAVSGREILRRILANLRQSYSAEGDTANLSWVMKLQLLVPGPTEMTLN